MRFVLIFLCLTATLFATAQRCATTTNSQSAFLLPSVVTSSSHTSTTGSGARDTLSNEVIVVPVVIHVLFHTTVQNISDAQILSQLAVLNNDYRRLNADTANTPAAFKSVAADARIVFCLAKVDPYGRNTSGIIRKYTSAELFLTDDEMKFSAKAGDDAWDSKRYLNIWVCNLFGRTLGYGLMPGAPADKDGVVIQYNVFGTTGVVSAPFNKGRTTTHEVGHWLGLRHPWGDAVCGDDGIADTPPQQTNNTNCPVFPHMSNCSINSYGDMFMNFMDFTDDGCMNMFTQGQKTEMRGQFAVGNFRNSFLNSSACDGSLAQGAPLPQDSIANRSSVFIYANPFNDQITITGKVPSDVVGKTAKIYGITGQLFMAQKLVSEKTTITISNMPHGIYILRLEGEGKPSIFKLLR
ncbi:MAG: M43 family zinc metalloprotease [Bacteroidota bacterium]|nr:M43 family zinc metalloprotease [Bacteroidota bacterium]